MSPRVKLTVRQAARYLHVSESTLKRMRSDGNGPAWFKAGDAVNSPILYEVADLDMWIRSRKGRC